MPESRVWLVWKSVTKAKQGSDEANRATAAVVGKTLEAALVVVLIGLLTTTLHAGIAPSYERTAGGDVADRVLVAAADDIEQAASVTRETTPRQSVQMQRTIHLPEKIAAGSYRVTADDGHLTLTHTGMNLERETALALPDAVQTVTGTWRSDALTILVVNGEPTGSPPNVTNVSIRLENG